MNQRTEEAMAANAVQFDKRTYTVDEIQDILGISRTSAYNLVKKKVLFDHSHELTPKEKEIWMLFDRVDVAELLARDAFAKGAYMLGAEDREIMLK